MKKAITTKIFHTNKARMAGYSLVELMIGLSLGMVLTAGVTSMYVQSKNNYQRMSDEVLRIGNAQYLGNTLRQEIQGAGYWGAYTKVGNASVLINPCSTTLADLELAIDQPVVGFDSPASSPLSCLTNSNFVAGTDILVLRRAASMPVRDPDAMVNGDVYVQSNPQEIMLQLGNPAGFVPSALNAGNAVKDVGTTPGGNAPSIMIKRNIQDADPVKTGSRLAADVRKYHTDIYFVSPCTISANATSICTGGNDDGGDPLPSLKKLELTAAGGALRFEVVTVAEGVENMQIQYGIDTSPENEPGSGSPDFYTSNPSIADLEGLVSLDLAVLIRDRLPSQFNNQNIYTLADEQVGPFNDRFSRQVLNSNYRIANLSMRRAGSN